MKSILFNNACVITAHFFTLCLSFSFSYKGISRVVTFLALFNFQDAVLLSTLLSSAAFLLYHNFKLLSSTFFKFF